MKRLRDCAKGGRYFVRKALSGSAFRTWKSWLVIVPVVLKNSRTLINIWDLGRDNYDYKLSVPKNEALRPESVLDKWVIFYRSLLTETCFDGDEIKDG